MVSENMPHIAYFTFLSAFIYISYILFFICILENLLVSNFDKKGKVEIGNKVDLIARKLIPGAYILSIFITYKFFV